MYEQHATRRACLDKLLQNRKVIAYDINFINKDTPYNYPFQNIVCYIDVKMFLIGKLI